MLKTSTEIASAARHVGEAKAIKYIAKAGFDAWDFSMFDMCKTPYDTFRVRNAKDIYRTLTHPLHGSQYLAYARNLRRIGEHYGISCNQSHAPFPTSDEKVRSYLKRAIECTAEAGGKICVIHPQNDLSADENAEMYLALLPFAKQHGVKIAVENMWNWNGGNIGPAACSSPEDFNAHLDAVDDDYLVACLDIGHAEMAGVHTSAVEMIYALGNRLQALHIHDNDLVNDSHQLPFSMNIDFEAVMKALKDIHYQGDLTLEASEYLKKYNSDNVFEGLKEMANTANRLKNFTMI